MAGRSDEVDLEPLSGAPYRKPWYHIGAFNILWVVVLILIVIPFVTLILLVQKDVSCPDTAASTAPGSATEEQIQACLNQNLPNPNYKTEDTTPMGGPLLIQNATIWTGIAGEEPFPDADIYIVDGKIQNITSSGVRFPADQLAPGAQTINAMGRDLTPGIVDLHSHIGVYSWPDVDASQDGNELTNPTTPYVRAIDALNPADWAIPRTLGGGVTTAQILPGSGNLMGGEGTVIKLRSSSAVPTVQDLLLKDAPRVLKMACGENPKRVYGNRGQMPSSRLGNGWVMRQTFEKAQNLLTQQTAWCSQSPNPSTPFPRDLSLDGLVALLRGKVYLQNHCYTVCDMESMIRISHEFGFHISTFHHALEAYKLANKIYSENISIALFIDHWGFKLEAYDASAYGASVLDKAGVNVIFKSDHPVLDSRYMQYEAAKGLAYNFTASNALASVTSRPAKAIGLQDRLGSIRTGLDADVVVWDRDPLVLGATPYMVFVDGVKLVDNSATLPLTPHPRHDTPLSYVVEQGIQICPSTGSPTYLNSYALVGVKIYTMDNGTTDAVLNQNIIVEDGLVQCIGDSTVCDTSLIAKTFSLNGGVVIPGIIEGGSHIGQDEIEAESTTQDGSISGSGTDGSSLAINAIDGIRLAAKHVRNPWIGGVLVAVSRPMGYQMVQGVSVAFQTCCGTVVDDSLVKDRVAPHLYVGNNVKQDGFSASYSGQMAALRSLFDTALENINATDHDLQPLIDALPPNNKWPVVIEADSVDVINRLIHIQEAYGFRLVILGGAEAHLVADHLGSLTPPAGVLYKARPEPDTFERHRNVENAPIILTNARVTVGLIADSTETARTLRWEAGIMREWGWDEKTAIAAITTNVAQLYGLPSPFGSIKVGEHANFLLFNGDDPLSTLTSLEVIFNGEWVECQAKQP